MQGHSHQIWSGQVRSVCARMLYPRRVWGHALSIKFLPMRLHLRPFLGQYDASQRPEGRVSHEYLHFLPIVLYTISVGFLIQFVYRPKATPFADEACKTNCSLVRTESWRNSSVALFVAISQVST